MVATAKNSEFFRCPVTAENSSAVIRIRRQRMNVRLQEASIDGFTVLVCPQDSRLLRIGEPWLLMHDGATLEVLAQWFFQAADGQVQIGLRRLRDLTPEPIIGGWRLRFLGGPATPDYSGSSLWMTGMAMAALLVLAMPGVGDVLGTSTGIQRLVSGVWEGLSFHRH